MHIATFKLKLNLLLYFPLFSFFLGPPETPKRRAPVPFSSLFGPLGRLLGPSGGLFVAFFVPREASCGYLQGPGGLLGQFWVPFLLIWTLFG